ncbi:DnaJ domain-containing protein [Halobaculum sp. WSA2]|uniref:DnaJ domain-containing protein n=1 Tax=Halobaculum saliterrae TaxID=2073113 RepID=A0A6B0SNC1_9EURY|nr:ferredoxin Fer [Halobaculum saliterrae]MXR40384.1 DnaJ domain-containing protein [Halobaculum saliterrae]
MDSPYAVLGVEADADDTEIERAYRRRVKEAHPDRGGSAEEFQRVRAAYEAATSGTAIPQSDVENGASGSREESPPEADDESHGDRTDRSDGERDGTGGERTPTNTRVEYLNYDAVADHGWEIDDPDLFEAASSADLDHADYGVFLAEPGETLLEAAEHRGFAWPFACRGGACANCAVAVVEGELDSTVDNVLTDDLVERGFRLSCIGRPVSETLRVIYNVKHLPGLDDLRLPADRFERARADD